MPKELPRYVTAFKDRHGVERLRFRKAGLPSHYFRSRFGTDAFRQERRDCLAGIAQVRENPPPGLAKMKRRMAAIGAQIAKADTRCKAKKEPLVYFIVGRPGLIKIGSSIYPKKRLATLQTACPDKLRIIAITPGGVAKEREYHNLFAHLRVSGEWFRRAPDLIAAIVEVREAGGKRLTGSGVVSNL